MNDLENSLLSFAEIISKNEVQKAPGTIMIKATIVKNEDTAKIVEEDEGEYRIKYLDSFLTAKALNKDIIYFDGDRVNVLIPNGQFDDDNKIIINSIGKNTVRYDEIEDNILSKVSDNLFTALGEIKMRTSFNDIAIFNGIEYIQIPKPMELDENGNPEIIGEIPNPDDISPIYLYLFQKKTIYDLDVFGNSDDDTYFISVLNSYLKDYNTFRLSMKIKTDIIPSQQIRGNYGLILTLPIKHKGSNGEYVTLSKSYKLDINNILGNPYKLQEWSVQNMYINLDIGTELDTSVPPTLQIFISDFDEGVYGVDAHGELQINAPYDIFIKDISFEVYKSVDENSRKGYHLHLQADGGNFFFGQKTADENHPNVITHKTLTPILKLDGKQINLKSNNIKNQEKYLCYWFIEDSLIETNDDLYVNFGGVGWRCLNDRTRERQNDDGSYQFDFITNDYTYNVQRKDVLSSARFKCVIVVMDTVNNKLQYSKVVSSEIRLEEKYDPIVIKLTSDRESNAYPNTGGEIVLSCSIEKGYEPPTADTVVFFKWNRYDYTGKYLDSNFGRENTAENNKMESIIFDSDIIQNDINTITCSVYDKYTQDKIVIERLLGSATIAITLTDVSSSVIIGNANMLFKYDGDGDSPTSPKFNGPDGSKMIIQPITLSIYNNETGSELTEEEYKQCTIKWSVPGQDYTMITPMMGKDDITIEEEKSKLENTTTPEVQNEEEDKELKNENSFEVNPSREKHTFTLTGLTKADYSFYYGISNTFSYSKMNNQVEVEVIYNQQSQILSTDFYFTKDGDPGTNNSNYTVIITHNGDAYGEQFLKTVPIYNEEGEVTGEQKINIERKLQLIYVQGEYVNVKEIEEGTNNPTDKDKVIKIPVLDENGKQKKDEEGNLLYTEINVVDIEPFADKSHWYYYDYDKNSLESLAHIEKDNDGNEVIQLAANLPSLKLRLFKSGKEIELDPSTIEIEWSVFDPATMDSTILLKSLSEESGSDSIVNDFDTAVLGTGCHIAPLWWQNIINDETKEIIGKEKNISIWPKEKLVGEDAYRFTPMNIVKAKVMIYADGVPSRDGGEEELNSLTQNFIELYAYYPIEIIMVDTKEIIELDASKNKYYIPNIKGGFSFVTYTSDGKSPGYNSSNPFEFIDSLNPKITLEHNNYKWIGGGNISTESYEYTETEIDEQGNKITITTPREDKEKIWGVPRGSFDAKMGKNYIRTEIDNLGSYEDEIEKKQKEKVLIDNDINFLTNLQNSLVLRVTENKKTTVSGLVIDTLKKANLPLDNSKPYLQYRLQLFKQFKEMEKRYNNLKKKYFPNEELLDFTELKNSLITEKFKGRNIFAFKWDEMIEGQLEYINLNPLKDIVNGTNNSGININPCYDYITPVVTKMNELIAKETKKKKINTLTTARNNYTNYINNKVNKKIQTFTDTVMDNKKQAFNIKESYIAFLDLQEKYENLIKSYKDNLTNLFNIHYGNIIKADDPNTTGNNEREKSIEQLLTEKNFIESVRNYYEIYHLIEEKLYGENKINHFKNPDMNTYDKINNNIINKVYKEIKATYYNTENKKLRKKVTEPIQTVKTPLEEQSNLLRMQIQELELILSNKQKQENAVVMVYIKPIIMTTNRYELTAIAGWDGSRLYVNQEEGAYLFAPQVGAGRKNRDGTFTGMVMGRRGQSSSETEDVGLFGYSKGEQSMFLDADTGAAYFGPNDEIQLIPHGVSTIAGWEICPDRLISNKDGARVGLYTFGANFSDVNSANEKIAFGASHGNSYAYITYEGHFYTNHGEIKGVTITNSTISGDTKISNIDIDELKTIKKLKENENNIQTDYGFEFSKEHIRHYKITQTPNAIDKNNPTFEDGEWKMTKDGKVFFNMINIDRFFSIGGEGTNIWTRGFITDENNEQVLDENLNINNAIISRWDVNNGFISRNFKVNHMEADRADDKLIYLGFADEEAAKVKEEDIEYEDAFYLLANGTVFCKSLQTVDNNGALVTGYSGELVTSDNKTFVFVNGILIEIKGENDNGTT